MNVLKTILGSLGFCFFTFAKKLTAQRDLQLLTIQCTLQQNLQIQPQSFNRYEDKYNINLDETKDRIQKKKIIVNFQLHVINKCRWTKLPKSLLAS